MPKKSSIPDRWEEYTPVGERIDGTRFIAFRVPLHMGLCRKVAEEQRFTPADLLEEVEKKGYELGLIIDLTFTTRYYNKEVFLDRDIQYEKVFTAGHVVPKKSVRKRFFSVVDTFLEQNKDNDLLIGVHCTHGLNRTGYLICRYMIDNMKISPQKAVTTFNQARGHKMERENYLEDLELGKSTHELPDDDETNTPPKMNSRIEEHSDTKERYSDRRTRDRGTDLPLEHKGYRTSSSRWQKRSYSGQDDQIPKHRRSHDSYSSSSLPRNNTRRYQDRTPNSFDRHFVQSEGYYERPNYWRREDDYRNNSYGHFGHQHPYRNSRMDNFTDYVERPYQYGHHPSRRDERHRHTPRYGQSSYHDRESIRGYY